MSSVVMVVSGSNVWTMKNAQPHPSGFWSEEFVMIAPPPLSQEFLERFPIVRFPS
jgi:hypothetical protein